MPTDPHALAEQAATAIKDRFGIAGLDAAFVLGSGWSAAADDLGELIGSCPWPSFPGSRLPPCWVTAGSCGWPAPRPAGWWRC